MPWTLPPSAELAALNPTEGPTMALPMAKTRSEPKPRPARMASVRCPLIVSTRDSAMSTPTSISTNKNSIKIAPV